MHFTAPEIADEVGIDFGHNAVGAFPILLNVVAPSVVQEELGEGNCSKETLNGSVHVAGHAEINKTSPRQLEVM